VDAALARFVLTPAAARPAVRSEAAFIKFLDACFLMRRKTLANNLRAGWGAERAAAALARLGLPAGVRAQALDLAQLVRLFNELDEAERTLDVPESMKA
jgi:16S rRNA A1518/A1519 N6-dimethyltransferase RsmA/KsgA/DIM1 with predicted DNA glycosylase/AP lyase activity